MAVDVSGLIDAMQDWITDGCNRALVDFVEGIPVPVITGRLLATKEFEFGSGFNWEGSITFNATSDDGFEYPSIVDDGESFEIRPVTKKALWWPGLDHPVAVVMWSTDNKGWFSDNIGEDRWAQTIEDDLGDLA